MRLMHWSPIHPGRGTLSLPDEFSRLVDDFLTRTPLSGDLAPMFAPPADIHETPEAFLVKLDLPGILLKDVRVSLSGEMLTIRGERHAEKSNPDVNPHRVERIHGSFERSFELGSPLRSDQVKATYREGVLEVIVPKADHAKVREIEVVAG
ncbi:MAG: Hsp20/alpha crystallin family protein [Candidatus Eisenbacteria bacterium]|nr:Hsp20/alpha crystallin family protein [Candidatus Eisenbacteria bacterium]